MKKLKNYSVQDILISLHKTGVEPVLAAIMLQDITQGITWIDLIEDLIVYTTYYNMEGDQHMELCDYIKDVRFYIYQRPEVVLA